VYIKTETAADANSLLRGTASLLPKPVSLFRIAGASFSRDDWSMICSLAGLFFVVSHSLRQCVFIKVLAR
jgi:hypothetical protein